MENKLVLYILFCFILSVCFALQQMAKPEMVPREWPWNQYRLGAETPESLEAPSLSVSPAILMSWIAMKYAFWVWGLEGEQVVKLQS